MVQIFIIATKKEKTWWWPIFYSLIGFAVLKGSIDGGVFARSQIVNIVILTAMIIDTSVLRKYVVLFSGVVVSLITSLILHYLQFQPFDALILSLKMAVLVGLFGLGILIISFEKKLWVKWSALGLIILATINAGITQTATINYDEILVAPTDQIIVFNPTKDNQSETLSINATTTIALLAKEKKLLANRLPIQIPWKTCNPVAPPYTYDMKVISNETPNIWEEKIGNNNLEISLDNNHNYSAKISLGPCTPSPLNMVQKLLEKADFNKFIIYDINQNTFN